MQFLKKYSYIGLLLLIALVIVLAGCDLKVDLNSNLNQDQSVNNSETKDQEKEPESVQSEESADQVEYQLITTEDDMLKRVTDKNAEVIIEDATELCETEVMVYAKPQNQPLLIVKPFDPGSDKYLNRLFVLNLDKQICSELEVSQELTDFGAHVLSPDQTKLAVALETNEARELKLLDLVYDKSLTLVELEKGQTFNGGYGAMSNQFNIKWQDNQTIQYAIFKDTYENYDPNAPDEPEKVLQVKVLEID
ncbi:MAG: hypothetical protein GF365_05370 [Candidatus Buchananbacteria bacterium]|nr:hypothetical protein [Candidatus Buchananbacteria bacterium]